MSSTPVRLAASISMTSTWRSSVIARQLAQVPQGSTVGPSALRQFNPLATIRAVVVLPTPRTPVRIKACATLPWAKALDKVRTSASWPFKSAKVVGRYLRASTREAPLSLAVIRSSMDRIIGQRGRRRKVGNDPNGNSLRLLPLGPDRVGEMFVRPTFHAHISRKSARGASFKEGRRKPIAGPLPAATRCVHSPP